MLLLAAAFLSGIALVIAFNVRILPIVTLATLLGATVISMSGEASFGAAFGLAVLACVLLQLGYFIGSLGLTLAVRQTAGTPAEQTRPASALVRLVRRAARS